MSAPRLGPRSDAIATENGWSVVVSGAADNWLPVYRSNGMTVIYAGDEAVVDVTSFSLAGGRNKSLRQAVNRVASAGLPHRVLRPRRPRSDPRRSAHRHARLR